MGSDSGISTIAATTPTTDQVRDYYSLSDGQQLTAADAVRILNVLIDRLNTDELNTSNISSTLVVVRDLIAMNTSNISRLDNLLATLLLELVNQGFEFECESLYNEIKKIEK